MNGFRERYYYFFKTMKCAVFIYIQVKNHHGDDIFFINIMNVFWWEGGYFDNAINLMEYTGGK